VIDVDHPLRIQVEDCARPRIVGPQLIPLQIGGGGEVAQIIAAHASCYSDKGAERALKAGIDDALDG